MEALEGVGFTHYAVSNHYFLSTVVQVSYVKNTLSLSKNIFSAPNFFMHIFNMFVIYLQSIQKMQWKLYEELISQSTHYQPLFTRWICRNKANLKTVSVCQK